MKELPTEGGQAQFPYKASPSLPFGPTWLQRVTGFGHTVMVVPKVPKVYVVCFRFAFHCSPRRQGLRDYCISPRYHALLQPVTIIIRRVCPPSKGAFGPLLLGSGGVVYQPKGSRWGWDVGSGRAHKHAMCVLLSCGWF